MRKYGDIRADGYFFLGYVKSGPRAGTEKWLSPEANEARLARSKLANEHREALRKSNPAFRKTFQAGVLRWFRGDYRRGMFYRAKSAGKRGVPFNLESIEDIPYATHCPIFGVELEMGSGANHRWSPSIDKIHPELGYTKGNVIVVSHLANSIKSNATPEQIMAVAKFFKKLWRQKNYSRKVEK